MSGSPSSPDPAVVQLELKRIVTSSLSNTKKGKALVELLAGEQALDAQGMMLGEVGLAILALAVQPTLSCLTSLDLRNNFIRDSGLEALALSLQKNPPLVFLNLQQNGIREAGATAMGVALRRNTVLTSLNLCYNDITDDGMCGLADGLPHNTTLRTLVIGANPYGSRGVVQLGQALLHNTSLQNLDVYRIRFSDGCGASLFHSLKSPSGLQELVVGTCLLGPSDVVALASAIQHSTALMHITLSMNNPGDEGASAIGAALGTNPPLQTLDLSLCNLSTEACEYIALGMRTNTRLRALSLRLNRIRDPAPLERLLTENTTLVQLDVMHNMIAKDRLLQVLSAASTNFSLRTLELSEDEFISKTTAAIMERNVLAEQIWGERASWFWCTSRFSSRSAAATAAIISVLRDPLHVLLTSNRVTQFDGHRMTSTIGSDIAAFL